MVFKFVNSSAPPSSSLSSTDIPEAEWYAYYESELSARDPMIEQSYEVALDPFLDAQPNRRFCG